MRGPLVSAMGLLLTPLLFAQGEVKEAAADKPSEAKAAYDQLFAEFDAALTDWSAKRQAVIKTAEYKKLVKERNREESRKLLAAVEAVDYDAFRERFLEGAEQYAGTDGAVPFLSWVTLKGRDQDASRNALAILVGEHAESAELIELASMLPRMSRRLGQEQTDDAIAILLELNPNKMVKAHLINGQAQLVLRNRKASAEDRQAAIADLRKVVEMAEGTDLALSAAPAIFQEERLQIGMEVPDIIGEDLDGVPFKLSDYRGKVVVLDFWGDW